MNETPRRAEEEYQAFLTHQAERIAGNLPTNDPKLKKIATTVAGLILHAECESLNPEYVERYHGGSSGC